VLTGTSLVLNGVQLVGARGTAISAPTGGAVIDVQARAAISAILSSLRTHGLIAV
jgi:hypothetical protein